VVLEELSSGSRKIEVVTNSVFNGNWAFGTTDVFLDRSHMMTRNIELLQGSTLKDKFMSDPEFAFTLETYANDTPAHNILPNESNRVLQSIIDY
jgi:hypothetical protein